MGETLRQKVEVRKAQEGGQTPKSLWLGHLSRYWGQSPGSTPAGPVLGPVLGPPCAEGTQTPFRPANVGLRARPDCLWGCRCACLGCQVNSPRNLQGKSPAIFQHILFLPRSCQGSELVTGHINAPQTCKLSSPGAGSLAGRGFPGRERKLVGLRGGGGEVRSGMREALYEAGEAATNYLLHSLLLCWCRIQTVSSPWSSPTS